jgi:hypothetical protein
VAARRDLDSEGVTAIVTLTDVQADFRQLRVHNLNHFLTPVPPRRRPRRRR